MKISMFISSLTINGTTFNGAISHCTFTGKERDEETGYGYFGARYMDHELLTGWLSVDPMADKYPSISPYAYCAWNPIKLIDPNGDSIHIGSQNRTEGNALLLSSLKRKTGLDLYVDNRGMMQYLKSESGEPISTDGSKSARNDLIDAIDNKDYHINLLYKNDDLKIDGGASEPKNQIMGISKIMIDIGDFSGAEPETFDIGMVFLHEFQHGYFGLKDNVNIFDEIYSCNDYNYYKKGCRGDVVDRVNIYRKELGLPTRETYAVSPFTNKIPFKIGNETIWIDSYKKN